MTGEALLEKNLRKGHFSVEKKQKRSYYSLVGKNLNKINIIKWFFSYALYHWMQVIWVKFYFLLLKKYYKTHSFMPDTCFTTNLCKTLTGVLE